MADRLSLNALFEELLGSENVYFQPPADIQMEYPAIRYKLDGIDADYADDGIYLQHREYEVTLIDHNPDSEYIDKLHSIHFSTFSRHYAADGLNHWVFKLTY